MYTHRQTDRESRNRFRLGRQKESQADRDEAKEKESLRYVDMGRQTERRREAFTFKKER
jgi:hypothetical protein